MKNTATKVINLDQLTKRYANRWVAIKPVSGKVVATADTMMALAAKFKKGIPSDVVIHRVLTPEVHFAPKVV